MIMEDINIRKVTTKGGGFLGLFQSNQPYAQMSFAESVFPQLQSGLFTADLNFKAKGSYNFGYIDQQRFSTAITYMPVRHWNNWIVETSAYSVGSNAAKTKTWKALVGMLTRCLCKVGTDLMRNRYRNDKCLVAPRRSNRILLPSPQLPTARLPRRDLPRPLRLYQSCPPATNLHLHASGPKSPISATRRLGRSKY
jgi:hypothetical protein